MDDAIEDTKRYAKKEERVPRTVRRWKDGKNPSWLSDTVQHMRRVHESGGDIYRIASHVQGAAKWIVLRGKSTAELVERYHLLVDGEHDFEAMQNKAIQTGTASEITAAAEAHAARLTEIAAVRFELDVRGVNPRDHTRSNGSHR